MIGGRKAAGVLILALLASACGPEPPAGPDAPPPLPTEDVGPGLTIDPSEDRREVRSAGRLAGVLPGDFPSDLPLHLPASIVELEGRSVTFLSSGSVSTVRRDLVRQLEAGGWVLEGAGGSVAVRRGAVRARLGLEDARPGTRYTWSW